MSNGNDDITQLLEKYGTSLEETRKLMPELQTAITEQRAIKPPAFPEMPQFFTAEEVKGLGLTTEAGEPFELDEGWMLKLTPGVNGAEPTYSFITPEKWEITQNQEYISPEGQKFTRAELDALMATPEVTPAEYGAQEFLRWTGKEISPEEYAGIFAEMDFERLYTDLLATGRTPETEFLLETIFPEATPEDINELFAQPSVEVAETPKAVLGLEPEWFNVRTGEVIAQSEKARRYPKGYEAELDEWVLTPETARNYVSVFKVFGQSLTLLPKQWGAAILQAFQGKGGASVVDKDWADRWIEEASTEQQQFAARVAEKYGKTRLPISLVDLAELPQNMAFSLTSMSAGLALGVPIAFIPFPGMRVAAWFAGTAASGAVAYNMSTYQIMQQYLEVKNEEMLTKVGRGLTAEEENALKQEFSRQAAAYGLWEAIPEAISNLAFARILTLPLGKMVGKAIASKIIGKLVGIYGEELLTETITQKGQSDIEVEAGLREGRISWVEAFKEIAPQTFLLTTILGGIGQVGISSVNKIKQSLKKEIGESPIYDVIKENITPEVFAEVEAESQQAIEEAKVEAKISPIAPEVTIKTTASEWNRMSFTERQNFAEKVGLPKAIASNRWVDLSPTQQETLLGKREVAIPKVPVTPSERARRAAEEAAPEVREAYEAQAEIEGLKEWLSTEPAARLTNLIKKTGWYKGEVKNLTKEQYRDITGKEPHASILGFETQIVTAKAHTTKAGKYVAERTYKTKREVVRWEYALDDIATEMGYESSDALKEAIERTGQGETRIKELESKIKAEFTEMPLPALPELTSEEAEANLAIIGQPTLTPTQVARTLELFGNYVESPSALNAWELTRELRRETRSGRAELLKARAQELIVEKGIAAEDAMKQAISETLSGELPVVRTDYVSDLTDDMRNVLFSKVYQTLKDEPFEMTSTVTALTNALVGRAIPREPGVTGRSAYTRLQRVFGDQPQVIKAIERLASEKKPLETVAEGLFQEVVVAGRETIQVDKETAEYLSKLKDTPYGLRTFFEPDFEMPRVSDLRTSAELEYAKAKLKLAIDFAEGRITKDTYDIAVLEARDKTYPPLPVTKFEAPIEGAFKQGEMWTSGGKQMLVRVLKEIGWSPIDIGNFIRANKASFDQSFLRQAKVLSSGHPLVAFEAHTTAWQSMFSQKHAEADWQRITQDPRFELYEQLRKDRDADPLRIPAFAMEKGTEQWRAAEEFGFPTVVRVIPRLTMKLPHIKYSERGFVAGTNKIVWRLWNLRLDSLLRESEKVASGRIKLPAGEAVDIIGEMGDFQVFLGNAIQRASLGKAKGLAPAFGAIFFAARSKLGRFFFPSHLLGITIREGRVGFNPHIMKEAWRDFAAMNAFFGGLLFFGQWLRLWDVEDDPRNAEFMSARIGNTRIDPWAGYRQFVVLYARLVTGTGISSVTGAEYEVNKVGALQTFIRTSLAPMTSILLDFWTGRNFLGQVVQITNARQWLERVLPFSIVDVWEAMEEDQKVGFLMILPAIYGEGVQTYTGDWEENFTKLGLPKYLENMAYGLTNPKYDTKDFWGDTASQFKDVDPATLTKEKGYPEYIRAIAEARIIIEYLDTLPNQKLVSLNADPAEGPTFADYYNQWKAREKLVAAGDKAVLTLKELQPDGTYKDVTYKGEDALKAFDQDERIRNANLGNFSQRQFALLNEYWMITDKKKQAEFLKQHEAEIGTNLRQDYLKSHPKENAQLAVWGQAKILTMEAYNQFKAMLKALDIPDNAIPELTLPPEGSIEAYFERNDIVDKWGANSWEDKLLRANNPELNTWLELGDIDTPIASLELKVKNRELSDKLTSYSDMESPDYIADDKARAEAIKKFKADNPEFVDDMRRIEAIEKGTNEAPINDALVNAHVEYGKLIDREGIGSSSAEVMLYRVDNPDYNTWRMNTDVWGDNALKPIDESRIPIWRIDVKYAKEDAEYQTILDKYKGREESARTKTYLEAHSEYRDDRRRRDAYDIDFPENLIEDYVEWYTNPKLEKPEGLEESYYEDDWWLMEHPDFYKAMFELKIWTEPRDFTNVPTREVYQLYRTYLGLPKGQARLDFRVQHPELDGWLAIAKGLIPVGDRGYEEAKKTAWEKLEEKRRFAEWLKGLKPTPLAGEEKSGEGKGIDLEELVDKFLLTPIYVANEQIDRRIKDLKAKGGNVALTLAEKISEIANPLKQWARENPTLSWGELLEGVSPPKPQEYDPDKKIEIKTPTDIWRQYFAEYQVPIEEQKKIKDNEINVLPRAIAKLVYPEKEKAIRAWQKGTQTEIRVGAWSSAPLMAHELAHYKWFNELSTATKNAFAEWVQDGGSVLVGKVYFAKELKGEALEAAKKNYIVEIYADLYATLPFYHKDINPELTQQLKRFYPGFNIDYLTSIE